MLGAGTILAFRESEQEAKLLEKKKFLTELLEVLPLFAFEKEDRKFYRAIVAILSCHAGLKWNQVMLFLVDDSELKQASCEMALGGRGEKTQDELRLLLPNVLRSLRDVVQNAIDAPLPEREDSLYRAWVANEGEHRRIPFGRGEDHTPIVQWLAHGTNAPWHIISVKDDPWCQKHNSTMERAGSFLGPTLLAYPLSKSFALDMQWGQESEHPQTVGVALVGPFNGGDSPDKELTRVTLDLLGALIAQRWTSKRLRGMFGVLSPLYHSKLRESWKAVKDAYEESLIRPESDPHKKAAEAAAEVHEQIVERVEIARAALKNFDLYSEDKVDFRSFLVENEPKWISEWGHPKANPRLIVEVAGTTEKSIPVPCDRLILSDVFRTLLQNAVKAAGKHHHPEVTVLIRARVFPHKGIPCVEITIEDDAGGVDVEMEPFLFVKGASDDPNGSGDGLALVRTELLMYNGDLQYIPPRERGVGATFQILFRRSESHARERQPVPAHRR
jgi:hypothetical protein